MTKVLFRSWKIVLFLTLVYLILFLSSLIAGLLMNQKSDISMENRFLILILIYGPLWLFSEVVAVIINYRKTMSLVREMEIPLDLASQMVCELNYLDGRKAGEISYDEFDRDLDLYRSYGWIKEEK